MNKKRSYLWLLLAIPLAIGVYVYLQSNGASESSGDLGSGIFGLYVLLFGGPILIVGAIIYFLLHLKK